MLMTEYPSYDPIAVEPMREELRVVGFSDLLSPDDVDNCFAAAGSTLLILNSVCGCAAGNVRPGVALALQHAKIPNHLHAIFAGMEKAAVQQFRDKLGAVPPSSPFLVLIKDGEIRDFLQRSDIEKCTAEQVAGKLIRFFDAHCSAAGPSISPEVYENLQFVRQCGSKVPRFDG